MLLRFHRTASTSRLHPLITSLFYSHPFSTSPPPISDAAHRTLLLNSIRTLETADAVVAVDFFHRMLTLTPFPCIQDFNLLFGLVAKSQHYATAISLIKILHSLGDGSADVCTLNIAINCLCHMRKTTLGFAVLGLMTKIGLEPTLVTLNTIVNGLCIEGDVNHALWLVEKMENLGYHCNARTYGALVNGLCKIGDTSGALECLKKMVKRNLGPNVVVYNAILDGLCKRGLVGEALGLLHEMGVVNVEPNVVTYNCLIQDQAVVCDCFSSLLNSRSINTLPNLFRDLKNTPMDRRKEKNAPWLSVPQFGDWDQKGQVPDYSLDFSKIRETRKQNKTNISRASLGNEEEFMDSTTSSSVNTAHSSEHPQPHYHQTHSPTARKSFLSYFNCCVKA